MAQNCGRHLKSQMSHPEQGSLSKSQLNHLQLPSWLNAQLNHLLLSGKLKKMNLLVTDMEYQVHLQVSVILVRCINKDTVLLVLI